MQLEGTPIVVKPDAAVADVDEIESRLARPGDRFPGAPGCLLSGGDDVESDRPQGILEHRGLERIRLRGIDLQLDQLAANDVLPIAEGLGGDPVRAPEFRASAAAADDCCILT